MKKKLAFTLLVGFIIVNIVAYNHAYRFSHFEITSNEKTSKPEALNLLNKLKVLVLGITNPKPKNTKFPNITYEVVKLTTQDKYELDTWYIKHDNAIGTVALFHGYTGTKSDLINEAYAFHKLGYNTLLVDFFGSGSSTGNKTTIGYYEAEDVKKVYDFLVSKKESNIILYGVSMGAVAITKATANYTLHPSAIILECPYGSLLNTVQNRFDLMGIPSFGFAELLVFWGGIQNGYWGFNLNTIDFAKDIHIPTFVMHGKNDQRASLAEVEKVFDNLAGFKKLKLFENTEHESFYRKFPKEWSNEVTLFLNEIRD